MPSTTMRAASSRSAIARERRRDRARSVMATAGTAVEQPRDDLVGVDAVGFRLEVEQDAVAQHRQRHRA